MTDLEMTKLCAEAIGLLNVAISRLSSGRMTRDYDPLHDDAQAMALVKRFECEVKPPYLSGAAKVWQVTCRHPGGGYFGAYHADLNRAIVECCARMQSASESGADVQRQQAK